MCDVATLRVRALCRLAGNAWAPASVACRVSGELLSRRSTLYTCRTVDALEHCWLRVVAVKPKGCVPMVKRVYTPCEWAFTWNFEGLRPHTSLPVAPRPRRAHDPRASAVDSELKWLSSEQVTLNTVGGCGYRVVCHIGNTGRLYTA